MLGVNDVHINNGQIGQKIYTEREHLYKYKGEVDVPPMEMVDDILTLQNCGLASDAINTQVISFIEQKKLTLSMMIWSQ